MDGGDDFFSERRIDPLPTLAADAKIRAEEGLGGGGAETNDDFRLQNAELRVEPRAAGGDFAGAGFFVDAALAARLPFKMFDGVGDVNIGAVEAGGGKGFVEEFSGRADERFAGEIFIVAGLFADKDNAGVA